MITCLIHARIWCAHKSEPRSDRTPRLNHVQEVMKIWWTWLQMVIFGQFLVMFCCSTAEALPKHSYHVQVVICTRKNPSVSDKPLSTRHFPWYQRVTPVRWPCAAREKTPKLSRLTASPQVLTTAGTRIITSLPRVPPVVFRGLKVWSVQNFLQRPTPFWFCPASRHVYKSTVACLKLDINTNNIVCFTGDHFLAGVGRD